MTRTILFQRIDTEEHVGGTTVLLDLTAINRDQTTVSGFGLFQDFDLGGVQISGDWLTQAPASGAYQIGVGDLPVATKFRLFARAPSLEGLKTLARTLARYLEAGGTWEWKPDGAAASQYIDSVSSPAPTLLGGGAGDLMWIIDKLTSVNGLPVTLWRQPYLRTATIYGAASATLSPAVGSRSISVTNNGNKPALAAVTVTPPANAGLVQVRIARRAAGNLSEWPTIEGFEVEAATLTHGTAVSAVNDANASGGGHNYARTTLETGTGPFPNYLRARYVITPADLSSLRGSFVVWAVVRPSVVGSKTSTQVQVYPQLRWGIANTSDPAPNQCGRFLLDTTSMTGAAWFAVNMGTVTFDQTATALVIELWLQNVNNVAAATFDWDQVFLMPADEQTALCYVPGFHGNSTSQLDIWADTDLLAATNCKLPSTGATGDASAHGGYPSSTVMGNFATTYGGGNYTDEVGQSPPLAGTVYPAGIHTIEHDLVFQENDKAIVRDPTYKDFAELRVRDITHSTDVAVAQIVNQAQPWTTLTARVTFTSDGSSAYAFQIAMTSARSPLTGPAARKVNVGETRHAFMRTVGAANGSMVLNGKLRQAYVASATTPTTGSGSSSGQGFATSALRCPVFVELAPGVNVLTFDFVTLDSSAPTGLDVVDAREELGVSDAGRSYTVTIDSIERNSE